MRPGKAARILGAFVVAALTAWAFVMIIWIPLYGHRQTREFAESQESVPVEATIVREDPAGTKAWSVQDQQALLKLRDGLRHADFTGATPPRADQKFKLRIRRSDTRVDEYEVMLDERGSEHDMLYVVRRTGGSSIYGSAFKTPELRSALQQVLKEPSSRP